MGVGLDLGRFYLSYLAENVLKIAFNEAYFMVPLTHKATGHFLLGRRNMH